MAENTIKRAERKWKKSFLFFGVTLPCLFLLAAALCTWWGNDSYLWAAAEPAAEGMGEEGEEAEFVLPGYEETVWGRTDEAGRAIPGENRREEAWESEKAAEESAEEPVEGSAGQAEKTERKTEREKAADAADKVRIYIGGDEILFPDAIPRIVKDRVMVPLRPVFESRYVQSRVLWLPDSRQAAVFDQKGRCLLFTVDAGAYQILTKGEEEEIRKLDCPAVIRDGRFYLPLRALLETLAYKVQWNGASRRADIQDTYPGWRKLLPAQEWAAELAAWQEQMKEGCIPCYVKPYLL
ncbi:MAG: copper amine oxidase N-terminal domain-containing protein [Peptococcaceae bacterium]|nr:copper amine oxidase N-terminal domain-containing protein [Peptococcaceae bacterium]